MRSSLYKMPRPSNTVTVRRRADFTGVAALEVAKPVYVDRATECHVTPSNTAERMADYLSPEAGSVILEPSAGTGSLVRALEPFNVTTIAIERHVALANGLEGCICMDFMEYAGKPVDGVLMNPPFKHWRKHLEHALRLTKEGGTIIALLPATCRVGNELEMLSADTFALAKVQTKIIEIIK